MANRPYKRQNFPDVNATDDELRRYFIDEFQRIETALAPDSSSSQAPSVSTYTPTEAGLTKHFSGSIWGSFNSLGTSGWDSGYSTGDMTHTLSSAGSRITIDEDMDIVANFDAHMDFYAQNPHTSGNYYLYVALYRRRNGVNTQIAGPTGIYQYTPTDRGDSTYPMTLAYHGSVQDGDQISVRVSGPQPSDTGYMRALSASFIVRKV
jgi:hypothetical protein